VGAVGGANGVCRLVGGGGLGGASGVRGWWAPVAMGGAFGVRGRLAVLTTFVLTMNIFASPGVQTQCR
jgi:hypothetical protein